MSLRRIAAALSFALAALVAAPAPAMQTGAARRAVADVPAQIETAERVGRADPLEPLERVMLVLPSKDPEGRRRFLEAQQTPGAPEYHHWLSPAEFHARFGARPEDVATVASWLATQGFTVEPGNPARTTILFSGTVAQMEAAFQTRMGLYAKNGQPTVANELPASLPVTLAGRVAGFASLNGFTKKKPLSRVREVTKPLWTNGSKHYLAPGDFRTIYNLDALPNIDGSGTKVGVIGRTQLDMSDVRTFRSRFGLPAKDPQVLVNGPDPGIDSDQGEVSEACLDVEWAGAVSPNTQVVFVVSKSTDTSDGVDLSMQYAVEHDVADALTVSFGACERDLGNPSMVFYDNVWAQAAAQGISVFVASGDSGVAGCDGASAQSGTGPGINGLSSAPWSTSVGGTSFLDTDTTIPYWSSSNDPTTQASVFSYIPEGTWNESGAVSGGKQLLATGGGVSITFAKPSWQAGPGVPADGWRDTPDVSLNAAGHTGYLIIQSTPSSPHGLWSIYGTSAAAPAFAGIAAALVQATGGRLGNMNPTFYALGTAQYGGRGATVFHDVTSGHNSVPNVNGFNAGPGYDLVTGLGSVDVAALAAAWPSAAPVANLDFLLGAAPGALAVAPGSSGTSLVALSTLRGDTVARVTVSGLPGGVTATFQPTQLSSVSTGYASAGVPTKVTFSVGGGAAAGTYPVAVTASAGSVQRTVTIWLTISSSSTVPPPTGTETQVPVVLDVYGAAGSHYTSDLVAVNRSASDVTAQLRFTGSGATGPIVALAVPARRQLYVPDVIAWLAARGYSFPSGKLGTLYVTFTGVSDPSLVFAGSRISTPNQNGSVGGAFGTFAAAVPSGTASGGEAWVYGLKRNESFRSNLAVVHAPGGAASLSGGSPLSVEVQLFDGATGAPAGAPVTHTLQPGEFWQIDAFTNAASAQSAYARVRRLSGTDRFITYGVVNDGGSAGGGTSDGSLIVSGGTEGLVPIVLDIPGATHYQTEISLTNTSPQPVNVTLVYTASSAFGGAAFTGSASVGLAAGQQIQQTNALDWLRSLGIAIPTGGSQGGTLKVTGAVAIARTWNPAAQGGTYGVAYPALDAAHRATTSAWVYGLRQDADVRSNLAVADARVGDSATRDYVIEIYDADSGSASPVSSTTQTLAGGQWYQVSSILSGAGVTHGYVRVTVASGTSDFLVYGVVNDGPTAGSRTSDGSYVPMVVAN